MNLTVDASQAHDAVTLPLLRRNGACNEPLPFHPSRHRMTWTPSATRSDVVRMIRRYKEREFSIPSAAGKIAIDETRVVKRRDGASSVMDSAEVAALSWPEFCDVVRNSVIRKAVTAPPERRTDVTYTLRSEPETIGAFARYRDVARAEESTEEDCRAALASVMGVFRGKPMRSVAPRRMVAAIVKPRPSRHAGSHDADSDVRAWRDTVTNKLARIGRDEERALLLAEDLRAKLLETTNRLAAARSELQRATGGRKRSADGDLSAIVVTLLREEERALLNSLRSTVRLDEYSSGIDNLLVVCTVTPEVEEYCFRMAA